MVPSVRASSVTVLLDGTRMQPSLICLGAQGWSGRVSSSRVSWRVSRSWCHALVPTGWIWASVGGPGLVVPQVLQCFACCGGHRWSIEGKMGPNDDFSTRLSSGRAWQGASRDGHVGWQWVDGLSCRAAVIIKERFDAAVKRLRVRAGRDGAYRSQCVSVEDFRVEGIGR